MTADTHHLKLSGKEEAYCLAIVEGLSESDAYRKAYKPQRAKQKTIHEKASRIMGRGKVQARVAELMAPAIASAQMTRKEWLDRLTGFCRFDPRKMFDARGRPKKLIELGDNEAAAIAVFEVSETVQGQDGTQTLKRTYKLKFVDRLGAFALLAKACHYYADRQEETGLDGGTGSSEPHGEFFQCLDDPRRSLSPHGGRAASITVTSFQNASSG